MSEFELELIRRVSARMQEWQDNCIKEVLEGPDPQPGKWTSVKDRLPSTKKDEYVLAYGRPYAFCDHHGRDLQVQLCWVDPVRKHFYFGDGDWCFEPTHWMPLPSPPEES